MILWYKSDQKVGWKQLTKNPKAKFNMSNIIINDQYRKSIILLFTFIKFQLKRTITVYCD